MEPTIKKSHSPVHDMAFKFSLGRDNVWVEAPCEHKSSHSGLLFQMKYFLIILSLLVFLSNAFIGASLHTLVELESKEPEYSLLDGLTPNQVVKMTVFELTKVRI